jgi:hypothetical protein
LVDLLVRMEQLRVAHWGWRAPLMAAKRVVQRAHCSVDQTEMRAAQLVDLLGCWV